MLLQNIPRQFYLLIWITHWGKITDLLSLLRQNVVDSTQDEFQNII